MSSQKILKCWKESFGLFAWGQFKLITLASLNNFIRSTKLFLRYFWWLGLIEVSNLFISTVHISTYNLIRVQLTHCIVFFAYLLCCRASTERKDILYFWQYFKVLPLAILLLLPHNLVIIGTILVMAALFYLDSKFGFWDIIFAVKNGGVYAFCFPAVILITEFIFWLISTGIVCIIFFHSSGMLFSPGEVAFTSASDMALTVSSNFILIILRLIQISFLSIFYLRIKHSFPDLFGAK